MSTQVQTFIDMVNSETGLLATHLVGRSVLVRYVCEDVEWQEYLSILEGMTHKNKAVGNGHLFVVEPPGKIEYNGCLLRSHQLTT